MAVYDISGNVLATSFLRGKTERGNVQETYGYNTNADVFTNTRCEKMYKASGKVEVAFDDALSTGATINLRFFNGNAEYINGTSKDGSQTITFDMPTNAVYFKFSVSVTNGTERTEFFTIKAADLEEVYNPNIINAYVGDSLAFCYKVADGVYSSGRLLLPPNYSVDGNKVPMIVFVHGSFGMMTWDAKLGVFNEGTYFPYLQYLANEGFAVFDCYPWTDKITVGTNAYSPYGVPLSIQAYLSGIKYSCDRYNIDIDKVSLLCKSQGGHIGEWALTQDIFNFRTVCLFAPSTGTIYTRLFFNAGCRQAIVDSYDFEGTSSEISTFVSSGDMTNATVAGFVEKNKGKFVSLMPYVHGITNGSIDEFYHDTFESAYLTSVPQWLLDLGLPAKPSGAINIPACTNRTSYVKRSTIPTKFWCAWDDNEVSSYCNYAIYYWLQNGGADTAFRILPTGTGGHHAMDNSPLALKKSGTTALGISYTDMPLAYTEVVDFIRKKVGE